MKLNSSDLRRLYETNRKWASILPALFFMAAASAVLYGHVKNPSSYSRQFYSSDTFYIPALYLDIFRDGYGISGWKLPPAPAFFPDMPLYFISAYFSEDIRGSLALYAVLYLFLFYGAAVFLIHEFSGADNFPGALLLSSLSGGIMALLAAADFNLGSFRVLFVPSFHGGAVLMAVFLLAASCRLNRVKNIFLELLFYAVLSAGFLSDRMLVPAFLLPLAFALLYESAVRRNYNNLRLILISAVLYFLSRKAAHFLQAKGFVRIAELNANPLTLVKKIFEEKIDWSHLFSFETISRDFGILLFIPTVLFVIFLFLRFAYSFKKQSVLARYVFRSESQSQAVVLNFVTVLFMTFPAAAFAAALLSGEKVHVPRYYNILFLMPVVLIPSLMEIVRKKTGYIFASGILIFLFIFVSVSDRKPEIIREEELAVCLDALSEKYNFRHGLSDYWNAKSVTLFSRKNLRVFQASPVISMMYWVNNIDWYIREGGNYKFIITSDLEYPIILSLFGRPDDVRMCGSDEILIYHKSDTLKKFWLPEHIRVWKMATGN